MDAELVRGALASSATPFALTQVGTLAEARALLNAPVPPHLLLLDLKLPDGDGLELLGWLRERRLATAVVVLTVCDDQESTAVALHAGADDYLIKGEGELKRLASTLASARRRFLDSARRRSQRLRVLYAEHHQADIDLTRRHLIRYAPHIRLAVVPDASTVLERLPSAPDEACSYDLVLLDYRLPGMDALELVKVLRADRGLQIPIVMVSGQGGEEIAARALHLGADDYLTKHATYLRELPSTLERAYRQAELVREQRSLAEATDRLKLMMSASPVVLYSRGLGAPTPSIDWVSGNTPRLLGFSEAQVKLPGWWPERLHADDRERVLGEVEQLGAVGSLSLEYRFVDGWGRIRWMQDELRLLRDPQRRDPFEPDDEVAGLPQGAIGVWRDITETKESQARRQARLALLDRLLDGESLPRLLTQLALQLEQIRPELRVCIQLADRDDGSFCTAVAPSLPDSLVALLGSGVHGPGRPCCIPGRGSVVPTVVSDIASAPDWAGCAEEVQRAGLNACWSVPFKEEPGRLSGLFSVFLSEPLEPLESDLDLLGEFARMAQLALQRVRDAEHQREASILFRGAGEGIFITDARWRVIAVNPALAALPGYGGGDLVGKDIARMLAEAATPIWRREVERQLGAAGRWQGQVRGRQADGQAAPARLELVRVDDIEGRPSRYIGTVRAVGGGLGTEPASAPSLYDAHTGLPGPELATALLTQALLGARRREQALALLLLRPESVPEDAQQRDLIGRFAVVLRDQLPQESLLAHAADGALLVLLEDAHGPGEADAIIAELRGRVAASPDTQPPSPGSRSVGRSIPPMAITSRRCCGTPARRRLIRALPPEARRLRARVAGRRRAPCPPAP